MNKRLQTSPAPRWAGLKPSALSLVSIGFGGKIPRPVRAPSRAYATSDDVMQSRMDAAIHARVSQSNKANKLAKQTYAEMEGKR